MLTCSVCAAQKPEEEFHRDSRSPGGRRKQCKPCRSEYMRDRYARDGDKIKAKLDAYRAANPEVIRATDSARYYRDRDKRIELATEHRHIRRDRIEGGQPDKGITATALRRRDGDRCHYCGREMTFERSKGRKYRPNRATVEHLLPISRGGRHIWTNVVLACWECNLQKHAKTVTEWDSLKQQMAATA